MKSLARAYFWWHLLDSEIEKLTRVCEVCCENRAIPPKAFLKPFEWPTKP